MVVTFTTTNTQQMRKPNFSKWKNTNYSTNLKSVKCHKALVAAW